MWPSCAGLNEPPNSPMRKPFATGPGGRTQLLRAGSPTLRPCLAGAADDIFENRELFDADRPARVQLTGADADLRAHAEFAAIGELRRRIVHDDGGVERGQEALCSPVILRDDGFRVLRSIGRNV